MMRLSFKLVDLWTKYQTFYLKNKKMKETPLVQVVPINDRISRKTTTIQK